MFDTTAAHKYFVESIAKAYQALTDPIARENYEKYGHPDGRQVTYLFINNFSISRKNSELVIYTQLNLDVSVV